MAMEQVYRYLEKDLKRVEETISDNLHSSIKIIPELSNYILSAGGKRFRPILVLLSSGLFGYTGENIYTAACAIEYIHTATLLHDDVVDDSDTRRGRKSANKVWGNQASVLVGDFLFARAFYMMVYTLPPEALEVISNACTYLAEGEILQLTKAFDVNTTEEDYYNIIYGKTAALISTSCELGPILAGSSKEHREYMKRFGEEIGFAFQISDDILDIEGDPSITGKPSGNDFKEGKVTLPLIIALNKASDKERKFVRDALLEEEFSQELFSSVKEIIYKYNGIEEARNIVRQHIKKAKDIINIMPERKEKELLACIADFLEERNY